MLRGIYVYKCHSCGHKFVGADIEWACTAMSMPVRCPKCGSTHTGLAGLWSQLHMFDYINGNIKSKQK